LLIALLQILTGFALLYGAGDLLVRGSSRLALGFGISPLVVGLTVVAFGTSAPELAVSVNAALLGRDDIAIGNVIGSNICNIGLIVGLSGLLRAIQVESQLIRVDMPIMVACSLLLVGLLLDGRISRAEGALLATGIVGYVAFTLVMARRQGAASTATTGGLAEAAAARSRRLLSLGLVIAGVAGLTLGARVFVDGAVTIALTLGISTAVIGLTIVAVGTSLPELATSVIAALRREGDIAIGNIVGSNLFNILSILGITALIRPLSIGGVRLADVGVMLGFAVAMWLFMAWRSQVTRPEGGILLAAYLGYLGWLVSGALPAGA
jgi:cation:H+ antiporter